MNRQAFRSVCGRARPELEKTGYALNNYFREFSTSQWLTAADGEGSSNPADSPPKPSARQRTRAATNQINSLVKNRGSASTAGQRSRPGSQPGSSAGGAPKVIDVRSLPRGLGRGRGQGGAFRGRGATQIGAAQGSMRPQAPGSPGSGPGNRFSRGGSASGGGRGSGIRGRGGRGGGRGGGSTRGRGGAGGRGGRRNNQEDGGDKDKKMGGGRRQDPFEAMDPIEEEFDKAMRFGTSSQFTPSITLESLAAFTPANPSTEAGRKATVLDNLSALGTADPVATPQALQAGSYAADLEAGGLRFFADLKARDAAEQYLQEKKAKEAAAAAASSTSSDASPGAKEVKGGQEQIISGAEESIRKVIIDQAIQGNHETPQFATGPVALSRLWHLRSETYTKRDIERFEKKLTSLVGAGAGAGAGKGSPAADKAEAEAKASKKEIKEKAKAAVKA